MDAQNDGGDSSESCRTPDTHTSPSSCSGCQPLVTSLTRQAAAMERLAELLPQLVAQNQLLIELLADQEPEEPTEPTYLDGSPIDAQGAARP